MFRTAEATTVRISSHATPRRSASAAVCLAVVLAVVLFSPPLCAGTILLAGPASPQALSFTAKNWAGYVAAPDLTDPQPQAVNTDSVTAVSGSWIVPAVTPSTVSSASWQDCTVWVGIDGFSDQTVEQVGTESQIYNGVASYDAWFEMYPAGMADEITVSPGDLITASVTYNVPGHANQFQLSLSDVTSGQGFTVYKSPGKSSSASMSSAEWIVEAPTSTSILPLPEFGNVAFTNATATIDSTTGPIDDPAWQMETIYMVNGGDAMSPSGLTAVVSGPVVASDFDVVQAPEPSTLALLAAGASALAWRTLRARHRGRKIGWRAEKLTETVGPRRI